MPSFKIQGNIVDIFNKEIFFGEVIAEKGKIVSITKLSTTNYQLPTTNNISLYLK